MVTTGVVAGVAMLLMAALLLIFRLPELAFVIGRANADIEFFGRVVDENGAPVSGAEIKFMTTTAGDTVRIPIGPSGKIATIFSDASGAFHIKGYRGSSLEIRGVGKAGYRPTEGGAQRTYGFANGPSSHVPASRTPVEFLVVSSHKQKPDSLGSFQFRFIWNRDPIEITFGEDRDVLLLTPTRDRAEGEKNGYAWNVKVELKEGSVFGVRRGQSLNLAPLEGYQPSADLGIARSAARWEGAILGADVVMKTSKCKYVRAAFSIYGAREDGSPSGRVDIHMSPTGARYLE